MEGEVIYVNLVVLLLRDMGVPKEDSHLTRTFHAINIGQVSSDWASPLNWHQNSSAGVGIWKAIDTELPLLLTAKCWSWRNDSAGRILWVRHEESLVGLDDAARLRYNRAIGIMYISPKMKKKLAIPHRSSDSSAVHCIVLRQHSWSLLNFRGPQRFTLLESPSHKIWWLVQSNLTLCSSRLLFVLQNIIPTFTLVYVGLNNAAKNGQGTEAKESEYVWGYMNCI